MPIRNLLKENVFDANELRVITESYEEVLGRLGIVRGKDSVREEQVASRIIAEAKRGVIERGRLVRETLANLT